MDDNDGVGIADSLVASCCTVASARQTLLSLGPPPVRLIRIMLHATLDL